MSDDKIKFYEQVLELEPESRLFFPLARLYFQQNELPKARKVLQKGLDKHAQHFEARLLLASILIREGDTAQARQIHQKIFALLKNDHHFWESLVSILSSQDEKDLSLAAAFFARSGSDKPVTWTGVLRAGMNSLTEKRVQNKLPEPAEPDEGNIEAEVAADEPTGSEQGEMGSRPGLDTSSADDSRLSHDPDPNTDFPTSTAEQGENKSLDTAAQGDEFEEPEEMTDFDIENEARTRSMADILYGQEEYAKALDIYQELWRNSQPGDDLKEIEELIAGSKQALSGEEQGSNDNSEAQGNKEVENEKKDTSEAVDFLMNLADRLEAKSS
ncbi:MAG: tetratricopeptide repeat protein [Desulfonatronovibrio sp.]